MLKHEQQFFGPLYFLFSTNMILHFGYFCLLFDFV